MPIKVPRPLGPATPGPRLRMDRLQPRPAPAGGSWSTPSTCRPTPSGTSHDRLIGRVAHAGTLAPGRVRTPRSSTAVLPPAARPVPPDRPDRHLQRGPRRGAGESNNKHASADAADRHRARARTWCSLSTTLEHRPGAASSRSTSARPDAPGRPDHAGRRRLDGYRTSATRRPDRVPVRTPLQPPLRPNQSAIIPAPRPGPITSWSAASRSRPRHPRSPSWPTPSRSRSPTSRPTTRAATAGMSPPPSSARSSTPRRIVKLVRPGLAEYEPVALPGRRQHADRRRLRPPRRPRPACTTSRSSRRRRPTAVPLPCRDHAGAGRRRPRRPRLRGDGGLYGFSLQTSPTWTSPTSSTSSSACPSWANPARLEPALRRLRHQPPAAPGANVPWPSSARWSTPLANPAPGYALDLPDGATPASASPP